MCESFTPNGAKAPHKAIAASASRSAFIPEEYGQHTVQNAARLLPNAGYDERNLRSAAVIADGDS